MSFKQKVVSLVVLTNSIFCFSLPISQLMATELPVRGAKFKKACFRAGFLLFCKRALVFEFLLELSLRCD
ncbi:hypothetical protein FEK47_02875 [Escherichia sp. E3659]|nr:hypothetical protein FEK47_02875 [Escherichia sp. E3659]